MVFAFNDEMYQVTFQCPTNLGQNFHRYKKDSHRSARFGLYILSKKLYKQKHVYVFELFIIRFLSCGTNL